MSAAFRVRRLGDGEEAEFQRLVARYKFAGDAATRYRWIYHDNPQGRAVTWLAVDDATGAVVGFTSVLPREFRVDGRTVMGGIDFDAFVRPDWRRQGVAKALYTVSLREMAERAVPFRFVCSAPAPANMGAVLKAGGYVLGPLRVHVRPLSAAGLVAITHYAGPGAGALRGLASVVDGRLARLGRRGPARERKLQAVTARLLGGTGGEDAPSLREDEAALDALWDEAQARFGVVGRRDAAVLGWRYLRNPVCRQRLALFECHGRPVGWAALEFAPGRCLVVDRLLPADGRTARLAVAALRRLAAAEGAGRIAVLLSAACPDRRLFLRQGFLPGRTRQTLQFRCPDETLTSALADFGRWHFVSGDLNPEATPWSAETSPHEAFSDADYRGGAQEFRRNNS